MKNLLVSALIVLILGFVSTVCDADAEKGMVCPVSGKKATKVSAEYHGGEVYFCCKNCLKAFQSDSAKFSIKVFQNSSFGQSCSPSRLRRNMSIACPPSRGSRGLRQHSIRCRDKLEYARDKNNRGVVKLVEFHNN